MRERRRRQAVNQAVVANPLRQIAVQARVDLPVMLPDVQKDRQPVCRVGAVAEIENLKDQKQQIAVIGGGVDLPTDAVAQAEIPGKLGGGHLVVLRDIGEKGDRLHRCAVPRGKLLGGLAKAVVVGMRRAGLPDRYAVQQCAVRLVDEQRFLLRRGRREDRAPHRGPGKRGIVRVDHSPGRARRERFCMRDRSRCLCGGNRDLCRVGVPASGRYPVRRQECVNVPKPVQLRRTVTPPCFAFAFHPCPPFRGILSEYFIIPRFPAFVNQKRRKSRRIL